MHNKIFTKTDIRAISELRMRLVPLNLLKLYSACFSFADSSKVVQIMLINFSIYVSCFMLSSPGDIYVN